MIKSFLGLFSDHQSKPIPSSRNLIRYQDIPEHSKLGLIHESYPQVVGVPIVPRSPEFFCQRYADELHDFFNRLTLRKEDHPDSAQARSITVREAARLQGFADDFVFYGSAGDQYKMIGNAVPPAFSKILARAVRQLLFS